MTNNTVISPVYPMLIQKYNTLIPDPNANVLDKINTIIDYLNQTGKLTNDVVDQWNKVMVWAMNDGLNTDVCNKLETMLSSGEFDTLFQKYIVPSLGDIKTLQTNDKTSAVNAINEVDQLAKANQTNLGTLSNLTTTDKSSLVNAVNEADNLSKTNQTNIGTLSNLQTTDKGNLVAAINDNVAQLADIAPVIGINVKYPFGTNLTPAKGDGVTDDTAAIQAIINYAYANKLAVFFPTGNYYVTASLVINDRLTIIGSNHYWSDAIETTKWECVLTSTATNVFVGSTSGTSSSYFQTTVNIRNLAISGNGSNTLFQFMNLARSVITECMVYNFNYIINGQLTDVSEIYNNRFINIGTSLLSTRQGSIKATITDSKIHHNYIDGTSQGTSVLIDLEYGNYFDIHHNFIDYAQIGIQLDNSSNLGDVTDNLFDVCYNAINVNSASNIGIERNKFGKCSKNNTNLFTNLSSSNQSAYSSNNWNAISLGGGVNHISIFCNKAYQSDVLLSINNYGINNITSNGNINGYSSGQVIYYNRAQDINNPNDGVNMSIQEMDRKVVSSLPALSASYTGQSVIYTGKMCIRKIGNKDVQSLNITAGATTAGTLAVSLNGYTTNVSVSVGDSASTVASKVASASYVGYSTSLSGTTVTFTANIPGTVTAPSLSVGGTGVTGTFTNTTAGTNDYWTDAMNTTVT